MNFLNLLAERTGKMGANAILEILNPHPIFFSHLDFEKSLKR